MRAASSVRRARAPVALKVSLSLSREVRDKPLTRAKAKLRSPSGYMGRVVVAVLARN